MDAALCYGSLDDEIKCYNTIHSSFVTAQLLSLLSRHLHLHVPVLVVQGTHVNTKGARMLYEVAR